jgi:hypothetical protein
MIPAGVTDHQCARLHEGKLHLSAHGSVPIDPWARAASTAAESLAS